MVNYEYHPLACIFPMMTDVELHVLGGDIEANGQNDPCWLLDGKLLDGRNRCEACKLKGIEPKVKQYTGDDPLAFVISRNLHRRHLNESQRAMVAARIVREKQANSPTNNAKSANLPSASAADLLNVSVRSVGSATKVLEDGSADLAKAVDAGEATVSAAATVATLPKKEQAKAVAAGKVAEKAKEVRENPRCADCTRKGMFRDNCPACIDLRTEKKKKQRSKSDPKPKPDPLAIPFNPDADDPPELANIGHPFQEIMADLILLQGKITRVIRVVGSDGEVPPHIAKIRAYLQANLLLEYKPDKEKTVKEPVFIPLRGLVKQFDLAGHPGPAITDDRIRKIYEESCCGKTFIPLSHKRRRDQKKARR